MYLSFKYLLCKIFDVYLSFKYLTCRIDIFIYFPLFFQETYLEVRSFTDKSCGNSAGHSILKFSWKCIIQRNSLENVYTFVEKWVLKTNFVGSFPFTFRGRDDGFTNIHKYTQIFFHIYLTNTRQIFFPLNTLKCVFVIQYYRK